MRKIALLLIDIQKGFDDIDYWGGERNNSNAEKNCGILLNKFRELGQKIFHVQHSSRNIISPLNSKNRGFTIKDIVAPIDDEPVIIKDVNSAFIGTDLKERLDSEKITNLVIAGLTTDHCISTTARMAGNYGFNTIVVSDATATFAKIGVNGEGYSAELVHQITLASLKDEFAKILDTKEVVATLVNM